MEYDEFKTICQGNSEESDGWHSIEYMLDETGLRSRFEDKKDFVYVCYETGGAQGGSCWDGPDDEGAVEYETYNDIGFPSFDKIIHSVRPDLSSNDVSKIRHIFLKQGTFEEYEYYGNYTDYVLYVASIEDLHKELFPEQYSS